jgi:Skp family chaperone for outer membrane proteins
VKDGFAANPSGKLSEAQQQALATMSHTSERIENQMRATANSVYEQYKDKCIAEYRDAIASTVKDVAESHKLAVVLEKNDSLLSVDPGADLTAEVIAAVKAHPPTITPVAMPTLPAAPALPMPGILQSVPSTQP